MDLFLSVSHRCLDLACQPSYIRYWQHANNMQMIQRRSLQKKLTTLGLPNLSYEAFSRYFPVSNYQYYKKKIEHSILHAENALGMEKILHFQTQPIDDVQSKFIPYTTTFLDELDAALSVWIVGLYQQYPNLKNTSVYWEMCRFPQFDPQQRQSMFNDGLCLTSSKRILNDAIRAVPSEVDLIQNEYDRLFAIAVFLVADKHLGMISVWHADSAVKIIEVIQQQRSQIVDVLRTGVWPQADLKFLIAPRNCEQSYKLERLDVQQNHFWQQLWPNLQVISCWHQSKHQYATQKLKLLFAGLQFEVKGIWRTEGVVAIPFQERHPLAYQSHFYEFLNLLNKQIVPSWELKHSDLVCPIVTTASGLVRYMLNDVLEVTDFYMQIPCFKFIGRFDENLLGSEGIDDTVVQQIFERFRPKRTYSNLNSNILKLNATVVKYGELTSKYNV